MKTPRHPLAPAIFCLTLLTLAPELASTQELRRQVYLGAARDYLYGGLAREWDKVLAGSPLTLDERAQTVLARVNAFRAARRVVSRLFDLIATTSIYKPSPMDRWMRDVNTMCQHVMAQDQVVQSAGAHLLGGTPHNPFILGIIP